MWKKFNRDVDQTLAATVKGEADWRLQAMTTITEWIGEDKDSGMPCTKNQSVMRILNIRQEMKALKSQYKEAGEE